MKTRLLWLGFCTAVLLRVSATVVDAQYVYGWDRGQDVSPTFEGWQHNPDGTYSFYFGYLNRNAAEAITIPIGPDNTVDGGGDRGQPNFYPGRRWWVFKIVVPKDWPKDQRLVWTLRSQGRTNQAKAWLHPEWEVDAGLMSRNARDPFLFSGGGDDRSTDRANRAPSITGPSSHIITLPQTATLTVTAVDDGRPQPPAQQSQARARHGVRFRWMLYRGPASVWFDPETNGPSPTSPARAETKVTFSAAGSYRLRAIASDGQAFSMYDVDVTVNPGPSARTGR